MRINDNNNNDNNDNNKNNDDNDYNDNNNDDNYNNNNTIKCAFVAHSVLCKTMTLITSNYLKHMYISFTVSFFFGINKV